MLESLSANIEDTIGVEHEVIAIDNSNNDYSMCSAYNKGASMARYPFLCFSHEDVRFYTQGWGKIVTETLSEETIGLIGVAGAVCKPKAPGPWYIPREGFVRVHLIQGFGLGIKPKYELINPKEESISDVVCLDGLWLSCRRAVWQQNQFDDKTFKEFHFYDLDFSMQIFKKGYRVCVMYSILIEHFSTGSMNKSWISAADVFYKKWKRHLPVSVEQVRPYFHEIVRYESFKHFILLMMQNNYKGHVFFEAVLKYLTLHPKGWSFKKRVSMNIKQSFPLMYSLLKVFSPKRAVS